MKKYIGCSGYYYNHWKDHFYPEKLPKTKWLVYYSDYFNTVEINNTFYRMPQESAVKNWYSITPEGFMFSVKGYRYFTHLKRLIIDDAFMGYLNRFLQLAGLLKEKTGPLLWQFPGSFKADAERLEKFCKILSAEFTHVFEFRHESWFNDEFSEFLKKLDTAFALFPAPALFPAL